jgi:1,4-dihydroxy-2-naphthoate octaprenyltransferase
MAEIKQNSPRAWLLAARPKTLSAALIPVMVAAALATRAPRCSWRALVICALFASLMQIAANFINDLYDFLKGTDRDDRLGPERACAQGWISPHAMRWGIAVVLALALICGSLILIYGQWSMVNGQWSMVALGAACVVFAFLYTTILSYAGMGDLLVLLFFGLVPCCGTYFAATGTLTGQAWLAGFTCGVLIDTLLILNNYRDRDTDRLSGKRTLIAVMGEKFGRYFYLICGIAAWALTFFMELGVTSEELGIRSEELGINGQWSMVNGQWSILLTPLILTPYLILHIRTWRQMVRIRQGRALNHILGLTSRNMLIFGLLLSAALALL